jgi:hypothetical protein
MLVEQCDGVGSGLGTLFDEAPVGVSMHFDVLRPSAYAR